MSRLVETFGVKLSNLYEALGSKNEELLEATYEFLFSNKVPAHFVVPNPSETDKPLYKLYVAQLVNEGSIRWPNNSVLSSLLSSREENGSSTIYEQQFIICYSLRALFAQFTPFRWCGNWSSRIHWKVYDSLKTLPSFTTRTRQLWSYILLDGRPL